MTIELRRITGHNDEYMFGVAFSYFFDFLKLEIHFYLTSSVSLLSLKTNEW